MRPSAEVRSALRTLGNAAIGIGLGMSVLGTAFVVSQFATRQGSIAGATSSPSVVNAGVAVVTTRTPPPAPPTPPVSSPTPTSTPPPATATPTPAPRATPDPLAATAYSNSGPGALDADTEVIVKDGDRVAAGAALFKITGEGASSWHAFYDRGVSANVIASVAALPSGSELDPVAFFGNR